MELMHGILRLRLLHNSMRDKTLEERRLRHGRNVFPRREVISHLSRFYLESYFLPSVSVVRRVVSCGRHDK